MITPSIFAGFIYIAGANGRDHKAFHLTSAAKGGPQLRL
jgi:hypothetical protein